jgi:cold shock CspA family protein
MVLQGRVKWFNKVGGYGFITGPNGDIFVHHSELKVRNNVYRYLLEGEYVEYDEGESSNTEHNIQAKNVQGINGGELMCEVRRNTTAAPSGPGGNTGRGNGVAGRGGRGGRGRGGRSTSAVEETDVEMV